MHSLEVAMPRREQLSYIMLFCALLLVKNGKATMQESMALAPLSGGANNLAEELLRTAPSFTFTSPSLAG